jgi:hypothetical protein
MIFVGVIFPAVVTLLGYESNRLAGPTVTGALASTTPLFAALGAIVFLGEPLYSELNSKMSSSTSPSICEPRSANPHFSSTRMDPTF